MNDPSRKPGFVLPVAVTLTVLLGLYVGAYYAMVMPALSTFDEVGEPMVPAYRVFHGPLKRLFYPMHRLDRRIRPQTWKPPF